MVDPRSSADEGVWRKMNREIVRMNSRSIGNCRSEPGVVLGE